ncbi:MAG: MFS transporter [Proteobacteria bacterium]|nr:MFS transporter [Pseudomonadota bacterium]
MQKQILALGAILFSTALYIAGNGLVGVLIPARANIEHFSSLTLGIIGSAYFAGFVIGCFAGPRLLARVGHSRTFAVGAGVSAATILIQSLAVSEPVWILMRGAFGVAAACIYMVIESWLNDRATNETRGRIFSSYLTVTFSAIVVGQMLYGTASPNSDALFITCAICYALCLIPMGLTRLPQPHATEVPVLRPLKLYRVSPVGVMGCVAVGFANSAIWTLAPVFAQSHGLAKSWLGIFMSAFTLGGALIQLPLGRLSDRMDRRYIIAFVCICAAAAGLALALLPLGRTGILWLIGVFGMAALPLYGLSVAHTNDRTPRDAFVEASATLLLTNSLASVGGPTLAALAMGQFGSRSLFFYTAAIHVAMAAFTIARIATKDAAPAESRERYEAVPLPQTATFTEDTLDPRAADEQKSAA